MYWLIHMYIYAVHLEINAKKCESWPLTICAVFCSVIIRHRSCMVAACIVGSDTWCSLVTLLPLHTEPQFNHHTSSGGICFLGDPWQETVTSAGKEISWADIGIKIIIPPGAVHEGKPITVSVRPCLSGPFELPEDYELASPVYAISPGLEFNKDVKLFVTHFAKLQNEDDCENMTFLTTESSSLPGDSHSYRLLMQKNGVFQIGSKEGEISLKHFCKKAIGRKCKQAGNKPRGSRGGRT